MFPATLQRYFPLALVLFASILLIGGVDGFIPSFPHAKSLSTARLTNSMVSRPCPIIRSGHPTTTTTVFSSEKDNNDGVPSSPLDRPVLSAIDATSLIIFAGIGKASHSAVDGSLDVGAVLVTAFPFLVSWFLVAPLVGSYKPEATKDVQSAAIQSAKAWILAVPLGCLLRGIIKGYVPPLPFVIVTMISTLVILTLGRVGYTALAEVYVEMF